MNTKHEEATAVITTMGTPETAGKLESYLNSLYAVLDDIEFLTQKLAEAETEDTPFIIPLSSHFTLKLQAELVNNLNDILGLWESPQMGNEQYKQIASKLLLQCDLTECLFVTLMRMTNILDSDLKNGNAGALNRTEKICYGLIGLAVEDLFNRTNNGLLATFDFDKAERLAEAKAQ